MSKSKTLLVFLNENQPAGKVMNAIGHMMVGLGPRIPQGFMPEIRIFSGSESSIRAVRQTAYVRWQANRKTLIYSDFVHTTVEGSAQDHQNNTAMTLESELQYYGLAFGGEAEEIEALLNCHDNLTEYPGAGFPTRPDFDFLPEPNSFTDFVADDTANSFSIAIQREIPREKSLIALVIASLNMAQAANPADLRLHQYPDATGCIHPGMSEYGLVALKAKKKPEIGKMGSNEKLGNMLAVGRAQDGQSALAAVGLFGKRADVKDLTKQCNLWNDSILPGPK